MSSGLHREIIGDILRLGRDEAWAVGAQVGEKPLAGRLGVSRTPVRRALIDLSERGILRREPGTGFKLSRPIDAALIEECGQEATGGSDLYQRLLMERSAGQIGEEVTENALIAHFNASRGDVRRALQRLAAEGIVERQRGHGWRFNECLQTPEAIIESYAFREAVECAALSQPGYRIDRIELERMREAHAALMRRRGELAPEVWFRVNAHFHETVTAWSRNRFFLQAVKRQNALRRMHQYADFPQLTPEQIAQSCEEHLAILDALAIGDRKQAAALLSAHLRQAAQDWQN